jgi:transcriptional regulator with PAS, ATPase and Fis domain
MSTPGWVEGFQAAITVTDAAGVIVSMNEAAARVFAKYGGAALVGKNLLDCHPEPARSKVAALLRDQAGNAYTIEKAGKKKLIYQAPWFDRGRFAGLVELSIELPDPLPHFIRQGS